VSLEAEVSSLVNIVFFAFRLRFHHDVGLELKPLALPTVPWDLTEVTTDHS